MRLPNVQTAEVSHDKIVDYLLNSEHPDGAGKASFFLAAGFRVEQWEELSAAVLKLAVNNTVTRSVDSPHGSKYIVDGQLDTPGGQVVFVRTVWIVDKAGRNPRLVTAYPTRQGT